MLARILQPTIVLAIALAALWGCGERTPPSVRSVIDDARIDWAAATAGLTGKTEFGTASVAMTEFFQRRWSGMSASDRVTLAEAIGRREVHPSGSFAHGFEMAFLGAAIDNKDSETLRACLAGLSVDASFWTPIEFILVDGFAREQQRTNLLLLCAAAALRNSSGAAEVILRRVVGDLGPETPSEMRRMRAWIETNWDRIEIVPDYRQKVGDWIDGEPPTLLQWGMTHDQVRTVLRELDTAWLSAALGIEDSKSAHDAGLRAMAALVGHRWEALSSPARSCIAAELVHPDCPMEESRAIALQSELLLLAIASADDAVLRTILPRLMVDVVGHTDVVEFLLVDDLPRERQLTNLLLLGDAAAHPDASVSAKAAFRRVTVTLGADVPRDDASKHAAWIADHWDRIEVDPEYGEQLRMWSGVPQVIPRRRCCGGGGRESGAVMDAIQIRNVIQAAMDAGSVQRGRVRIRHQPLAGPMVDVIRGDCVIRVEYEERDQRFFVSVAPRRLGIALWWRGVDAADWVMLRGGDRPDAALAMIEGVVDLLAVIDRIASGAAGERRLPAHRR